MEKYINNTKEEAKEHLLWSLKYKKINKNLVRVSQTHVQNC